ncbi:MAG TPA: alpha-L-glutamate ligase [Sphingomicrobium sp.]
MSVPNPHATQLAVLYEHPQWFQPLFAALERRGMPYVPIQLNGHCFDPASNDMPAPLILSRVAQSSFLRESEHPIFYAAALLDHWARSGARVLNGADVLSIDSSKARQLSLINSLGYAIPQTRIVHRVRDLVAATDGMRWPLLVKANVGGSGAGIVSYSSPDELRASIADLTIPRSVDQVLLVQDYVPAESGTIIRIETLGGHYLYAIEVESGGDTFDLCPADACIAQSGRAARKMTAVTPPPQIVEAAERIALAAGLDLGGIEVVIDERDASPRFYDINAMSNFVADPLNVLGWDPHERLIDHLEQLLKGKEAA